MKLIFHRPHLSITAFASVEMPDFAILTGLNGSGKTHLLQAIQGGHVQVEGVDSPVIASFGPTDFAKGDEGVAKGGDLAQRIDACWELFQSLKEQLVMAQKGGGAGSEGASRMHQLLSRQWQSIFNLKRRRTRPPQAFSEQEREFPSLIQICESTGEGLPEAALADFRRHYPVFRDNDPVFGDVTPSPILNGISQIFWFYHCKMDQNTYNEHRNQLDGGSRSVMSREEFCAVNGREPWDVLNDLLQNHFKIPYRVNSPQDPDGTGKIPPLERDDTYEFALFHTDKKNIRMNFSSLSSGERLMMGLVLAMYKSSFKASKFPNVLLLDETDAVLHPSMVQQALDVIQRYFVKQQRMKVLMATHSPSTVAYAPEDSIYIVNPPGQEPRVEKQDKQTALSILTEGVVSFVFDSDARMKIRHSIRTRRKPLLLVEGFTDFLIIQKAWEKIRGTEIPFDIMDCFSAGLLRATLQNADDIVGKGESAKVFGLFDYDAAGYSQWEALKSGRWSDISAEDVQVKKSQEHEWHALLLPVPARLSEQAGGKHAKDSRLEIEHLFYGHPAVAKFFADEEGIGGGKIVAFHGDKRKFAERVVPTLPKEAFADFEPLFRFITEQIAPPAEAGGQG